MTSAREILRAAVAAAGCLLAAAAPAPAQFSPGPLSSAHASLEGPTNCTKCHDLGKEIGGSKCLDCHSEIRASIDRKGGYHGGQAANRACVDCHKEHLGADAKTYLFDPGSFDHDLTGFSLLGAHGKVRCAACHDAKFIREPKAKELSAKRRGGTYLGLGTRCADCHADVHKGKFGPECSTCHTAKAWKDVRSFDHSRTKFSLLGKHSAVACEKCHRPPDGAGGKKFAPIAPAAYADCAPCHASPHRPGAVKGACSTCHDPAGWGLAMEKPFDHASTRYPLEGAHARLRCIACHQPAKEKTFVQVFQRPFGRCTDCHADRHDGAFLEAYANDCARCHTTRGWSPSTFAAAQHQAPVWPLLGAHRAVLCADCHRRGPSGSPWLFRMKPTRCEACHEDIHKGQFASQKEGCASCHTADGWRKTAFAHGSLTAFPLEGKHATAGCESCHREVAAQPAGSKKYAKLASTCESCHKDAHRAQFASGGKTDCARCHAASGWKPAKFDHETGSSFRLTGAHAKTACAQCHKRETDADGSYARYRPLPSACESCHQKKEQQR